MALDVRNPTEDEAGAEDGRILVLGIGLVMLLLVAIVGGVDATSILLARMRVYDAADAAAVDAADSVDQSALYRNGVGQTLALTDATVYTAASGNIGLQQQPSHVTGWGLASGTGSPDGSTAVVRMTASIRPPLTGGLMRVFGQSVTVTVESHARSHLLR